MASTGSCAPGWGSVVPPACVDGAAVDVASVAGSEAADVDVASIGGVSIALCAGRGCASTMGRGSARGGRHVRRAGVSGVAVVGVWVGTVVVGAALGSAVVVGAPPTPHGALSHRPPIARLWGFIVSGGRLNRP